MQTVNFKCGHCGNLMGVEAEYLGQQVRCPHCQQVVVAPAQDPTIDATLPHVPSAPAPQPDETALLPPPDNPFAETSPPVKLSSAQEPTIALDSRSGPPAPSIDSTLPYTPAPLALDSTVAEAPSGPEIPDWMTPPAPAASPNGAVSELPAPRPLQAPRRSSLGMLLFITLVFMPLVLYSVLVTILAILIYVRSQADPPPDPREDLIDTQGDHPGAKKAKPVTKVFNADTKFATTPLPAQLRIKLGDAITLGDLRVKAERVERGQIKMVAKTGGKPEVRETLILRLHLTNVSTDSVFYPMDAYFNRKSDGKTPPVSLTVLLAGDQFRFFGGPATWNRGPQGKGDHTTTRYDVLDTRYDQELKPGEEMDTFVCTDGFDPERDDPLEAKFDDFMSYEGTAVWHVHVRRGFLHYKEHDYPTTAVIGVEFTGADVQKVN